MLLPSVIKCQLCYFFNQRSSKATGNIALLQQLGIHLYGIGLWPALRSYRTFIRPVLEYGLAIAALTPNHLVKLENAQNGCVKMALNLKASKQSATIVPMVLADIPSMKFRARTLQLKFAARIQTLPVSSMARSVELSFLWDKKQPNKQWKTITTNNPIHQRYNKLRNNNPPTTDPVKQAITEKRNEEYTSRRNKFKSISCMRSKRIIDPILYQPEFSRDRHRLVKWRMHWLPSYPLKECRCGYKEARREHFTNCLLLQPFL